MAREPTGAGRVSVAGPADPDPRPKLWVIRPRDPAGVLCVSLSPRLYECGTHYVPSLTADRGCAGTWDRCHWCRDGYEWRPKFYLAVWFARAEKVALLELTLGAVNGCPQLRDQSRSFRGCEVRVIRTLNKRNAPERVFIGTRDAGAVLPAEPDVPAALSRYWGESPLRPTRPEGGEG